MESAKNSNFVPRVTQLDAVELDNEVFKVLKTQVENAAKFLPISWLGRCTPEVDAILKFLVWKHSVHQNCGTFGQQLLSVKYGINLTQSKAILLALLTIAPKYVRDRSYEISRISRHPDFTDKASTVLDWLETAIQVSSIVNLVVFLKEGKYPTLTDRVLGLKHLPISMAGAQRSIGYDYMTRELLWHTFIEFLAFTLPLVNFHYVKRRLAKLLFRRKPRDETGNVAPYTLDTRCPVCSQSPVLPHRIGCPHIFCFYCIKAHFGADPNFECPQCEFIVGTESEIVPVQQRPVQ